MPPPPLPRDIPVSLAREQLSEIVFRVQDPREYRVLTRHGKPVAAIVSMASLERIWRDERADGWGDPAQRPGGGIRSLDGRYPSSQREAAEFVREIQLTRWQERQALARGGIAPLEGGEITVPIDVALEPPAKAAEPEAAAVRRRWWSRRRG